MALGARGNQLIVGVAIVGLLGLGAFAFVVGDDEGVPSAEPEGPTPETTTPPGAPPPFFPPPFPYPSGPFGACDQPTLEFVEETVVLTAEPSAGAPECDPLERLFRRKAGPVTIRAYLSPEIETTECEGAPGCPPPECLPNRQLVAGLSTEEAVGSAFSPLYGDPLEPLLVTSGRFGVGEGVPVAWAAVQVGPEVDTVRARFAGGGADEMPPKEGVAVLASPARLEDGTVEFGGTVEALDRSGNVTGTTELTGLPVVQRVLEKPECAPRPPTLPKPDGPPPANETEARQDVVDAYTITFGGQSTPEERLARIDDPHDLEGTREQVRQNFPEAPLDEVSVRVEELRFLNRTTAAVRYTIVLPGYSIPEFPNRIGQAVLIDGVWKVTRETVCHSLELGGVTCPP
ncbi:MAG: hypothetical protein ACT4PI_03850 [Actinomycetota bacterium]